MIVVFSCLKMFSHVVGIKGLNNIVHILIDSNKLYSTVASRSFFDSYLAKYQGVV